jgi:EpsI family protein
MFRKIDTLTISILILLIFAVFTARINFIKASGSAEMQKPEFIYRLGDWKFNQEIPISDDILRILGTKGAALGEYVDSSGDKLWLYILKSRGRRSSIHQPEYCYIGSGKNELLEKGRKMIDIDSQTKVPVNYIFVQNEKGFQVVVYFYTINDVITNNYYLQQLLFLQRRLSNRTAEASLIRLSKFSKSRKFTKDLQSLQHVAIQIVKKIKFINK